MKDHLLLAFLSTLLGIWWSVSSFCQIFDYFHCQKDHYQSGRKFKSRCMLPICGKLPVEGFVKATFALVGYAGEIYARLTANPGDHFSRCFYYQPVYLVLFINAAFEILYYNKHRLPKDCQYLLLMAYQLMESLLLYYDHETENNHHQFFMLCTSLCCAASTLMELMDRGNQMFPLCRSYFTLLKGTWLFQICFVLCLSNVCNQPYNLSVANASMQMTLIYASHAAIDLLIVAFLGWFTFDIVENMPPDKKSAFTVSVVNY